MRPRTLLPNMGVMDSSRSDIFLSRRGSVAELAQEVTDLLSRNGYSVVVQDYDIPLTSNFIERIHDAIKGSRDLVILFTRDYEESPFTRREFTSFEADRARDASQERRIIVLRCEDAPLRGLLAANVYQDLVGISDPEERAAKILAAVRGQSQAERPPPRPFIGVPPRLATFTGRLDALDRLDTVLTGGKVATVTQASRQAPDIGRAAVHGLGGIGKSSLAAEYAHRYRDLYAGVLWCPAETRLGLVGALAELGRHIGAPQTEGDPETRAKETLNRLTTLRANWLLVYDNVAAPEDIADLLPNDGARLLVTSRFPDWSGWAEEVALDTMPQAEACDFLARRTGRDDPAGAAALAQALGGLPLALDHAGAFCRRTQTSFSDYAARIGAMLPALPRGVAYPRSVAATFELAIAEATAQTPGARRMLDFIAQCAPERVPVTLAESAFDDAAEASLALLALADTSLLRNDPFPDGLPAVTMHRLVQAVARATATEAATIEAKIRLIDKIGQIAPRFDSGDFSNYPAVAAFLPHQLSQSDSPLPEEADDMKRLRLVGGGAGTLSFFDKEGHGIALLQQLHDYASARYGHLHPATYQAFNALLIQHLNDRNWTAAQVVMGDRLTVIEQLDPPADLQALAHCARLAHFHGLHDRRDFVERLLAIYERELPAAGQRLERTHPTYIGTVRAMSSLLDRVGKGEQATALTTRTLDDITGSDSLLTGDAIELIETHISQEYRAGRFHKSLPYIDYLVARAARGDHDLDTTKLLYHTAAQLYFGRGLYQKARICLEAVIAANEDTPQHKNTYNSTIAFKFQIDDELGFSDATIERLYQEIAKDEMYINDKNDSIRNSSITSLSYKLRNLAEVLLKYGFLVKAMELSKKSHTTSQYQEDDSRIIESEFLIGKILLEMGENELAITRLDQDTSRYGTNFSRFYPFRHELTLARALKKSDKDNYRALENALNIIGTETTRDNDNFFERTTSSYRRAMIRAEQSKYLEAKAEISITFQSEDDYCLLNAEAIELFSRVQEELRDLASAEALRERLRQLYEEGYGPDSIWTAGNLSEFAQFHRRQGDHAKARPLQERALSIAVASAGPGAPLTARIRTAMAELLLAEGRLAEAGAEASQAHETLLATAGPHNEFTLRAQKVMQASAN